MNDLTFEIPVVVILFIWSTVIVWASLAMRRTAHELDREREALRRWSRLRRVAEQQNSKWQ